MTGRTTFDFLDDDGLIPGPGQLGHIRKLLGLTVKEAAAMLGVTTTVLNYYERSDIRVIKLQKLINHIEGLGGRVTLTAEFDNKRNPE